MQKILEDYVGTVNINDRVPISICFVDDIDLVGGTDNKIRSLAANKKSRNTDQCHNMARI